MSDELYIGRVKWVHDNYEKKYRHATVEPLLQSSEDKKSWVDLLGNRFAEFPARGYVNWHDAPKDLEEGDFRQFDIERHPFYSGEPDKEAFQVKNHDLPTEIIDLRSIGTERDIRILLTTKGTPLNDEPLIKRCLLWVQEEKWIGPVDLVRRNGTKSWILEPNKSLDNIRSWKIPCESIQRVELDGKRFLLAPYEEKFGQYLGLVTWESDETIAKRVLRRLLKRDRKTAEALNVTKEVFKTYIETIDEAGLVGPQLSHELAFHGRIKEIFDAISRNEELLDEAAKACFAIGPVKQKVAEKAEEEYQNRLKEHERRLDESLEEKKSELQVIIQDLSAKKSELSRIEEQIRSLEKALDDKKAEFESELEEKLRQLAERPKKFFAEMAVARALTPSSSPDYVVNTIKYAKEEKTDIAVSDAPITKDANSLKINLSTRLMASCISPFVGQALHATFLSGLVPVLIGSDGYELMSSYAECVTGGKLHWIPVGGSLFEPSDLLARFDPNCRCLIPHSGGLLDILLDESDTVHIVVLDGFNRAAVDAYLEPVLKSVMDIAQGKKPRTIPLAPNGFIRKDGGYNGVERISWCSNVLLALCPSRGSSTLPIPADFWIYCTVLDSDKREPVESKPDLIPQKTRVSAGMWESWTENVKTRTASLEFQDKNLKNLGFLPKIMHRNLKNLTGAGEALGMTVERSYEQAIKMCLLPYLVANLESDEEVRRHLGFDINETDKKIYDAVQKLGE